MYMVLSLASQWLHSQSFVMPSASAWIKAVRGAGWRSYDSASCLEALLFGNGEGKWEKGRWKMSVVWPNREAEGWGRIKSIGVQMFPFLPLILSFVLYMLLFFFKLVSDLIWSRLLTWLSIVNHHANVFQVFPIVRLKITWWVREETVKGQISKPESQKVRFDETAIFKQGKKRKMMGGFYLYLCPQPISIL